MQHIRIRAITFVLFVLFVHTAHYQISAEDSKPKCITRGNYDDRRSIENDSPYNWKENGVKAPCYSGIYTIVGIVAGDPTSVTRQTSPGGGSVGGAMIGGYGYIGGSFFGPQFNGKGVVRLLVQSSPKDVQDVAPEGQVTLLKTTDIKAVGLVPGDQVTFKCRKEYEPVAAIIEAERFTEQTLYEAATYELDYCRLTYSTLLAGQGQ